VDSTPHPAGNCTQESSTIASSRTIGPTTRVALGDQYFDELVKARAVENRGRTVMSFLHGSAAPDCNRLNTASISIGIG
jgi:hypothetical protein